MSGIAETRAASPAEPVASWFEFWPGWLFHAPIVVQWIALGLRHGDLSLPTAANPYITTGGLCGESKVAILDQISGPHRALVAPYVAVRRQPDEAASLACTEAARLAAGLGWPLVAKPDIGCNGTGVRKLADPAALAAYVRDFPVGADLLLQQFVPDPGEAGIFYVRLPGQARGRITSLTLKSSPVMVGDGQSSLRALILADPRASQVAELYLTPLAARLAEIPARGERVPLVFVGNHCKGALFRDGAADITPALEEAIEQVARALPEFHFGRLDVRFTSLAALRRGEGFRIIEINGVGAEATHVWDPAFSLRAAWAAQFAHYAAAFAIGRANRRRGFKPSGLATMARAWRLQRHLLARYPSHE
jgi:hypothetical protein